MAKIELKDGYRLRSDANQWIVEKSLNKTDDKGNELYSNVSYHGSVNSAINSTFDLIIRKCDAESFLELREYALKTIEELTEIFEGKYNVR